MLKRVDPSTKIGRVHRATLPQNITVYKLTYKFGVELASGFVQKDAQASIFRNSLLVRTRCSECVKRVYYSYDATMQGNCVATYSGCLALAVPVLVMR